MTVDSPQPRAVAPARPDDSVCAVLRSPRLLTREALAGIVTTLALVPEVISFSVIAGVDPMVSLVSSVVLAIVMSLLGGRPAMVTAAAGSVALVVAPLVQQHGVEYVLPAVLLAGVIQVAFEKIKILLNLLFVVLFGKTALIDCSPDHNEFTLRYHIDRLLQNSHNVSPFGPINNLNSLITCLTLTGEAEADQSHHENT